LGGLLSRCAQKVLATCRTDSDASCTAGEFPTWETLLRDLDRPLPNRANDVLALRYLGGRFEGLAGKPHGDAGLRVGEPLAGYRAGDVLTTGDPFGGRKGALDDRTPT